MDVDDVEDLDPEQMQMSMDTPGPSASTPKSTRKRTTGGELQPYETCSRLKRQCRHGAYGDNGDVRDSTSCGIHGKLSILSVVFQQENVDHGFQVRHLDVSLAAAAYTWHITIYYFQSAAQS